jgi:uncharacterized membrane protein YgcG
VSLQYSHKLTLARRPHWLKASAGYQWQRRCGNVSTSVTVCLIREVLLTAGVTPPSTKSIKASHTSRRKITSGKYTESTTRSSVTTPAPTGALTQARCSAYLALAGRDRAIHNGKLAGVTGAIRIVGHHRGAILVEYTPKDRRLQHVLNLTVAAVAAAALQAVERQCRRQQRQCRRQQQQRRRQQQQHRSGGSRSSKSGSSGGGGGSSGGGSGGSGSGMWCTTCQCNALASLHVSFIETGSPPPHAKDGDSPSLHLFQVGAKHTTPCYE